MEEIFDRWNSPYFQAIAWTGRHRCHYWGRWILVDLEGIQAAYLSGKLCPKFRKWIDERIENEQ